MAIVIGTHHKAGTNFFLKFVRDLSQKYGIAVWERTAEPSTSEPPNYWDIYFDHWSNWVIDLDRLKFSGIHAIRHPCALIYSAMLYHCVSEESWLHKPEKRLGGRTYAEYLNALGSIEDQLIFEMNNSSKRAIEGMLDIRKDERFFDVTLENISHDPEMKDLRGAFKWCGLVDEQMTAWLGVAAKFCLWNSAEVPAHGTTGVDDQWKKYFYGDVLAEYRKLFGDAEEKLGYERW